MNARPATVTRSFLAAALVAVASCTAPIPLTDYCPGDPMRAWCNAERDCSGPYECVSYCIRRLPDRTGVPDSGMGSWCDDPALPEDYGLFCAAHADVGGCGGYCQDHPGTCEVEADGDADGDVDADADADGGCEGHDDCTSFTASRCHEGACGPCRGHGDCAHLGATPDCNEGTCVECVDESVCDDGSGCSVASCESFACLFDLDVDDDGSDCTADCDDEDGDNFPGNPEVCDRADNDCDGEPEASFALDVSPVDVAEMGAGPVSVSIAWSGAVHAVAWCHRGPTDSSLAVALVDPSGAVTGRLAPTSADDDGCVATDVAWTGSDFVVVWVDECDLTFASTFSPTAAAPSAALPLDAHLHATGVAIAHSGGDRLAVVLRSESSTATSVYDDTFARIGSAIPRGSDTTTWADVAAGPSGFLVMWTGRTVADGPLVRSNVVPFDAREPDTQTLERGSGDSVYFSAAAAWTGDGWVAAWARMDGSTMTVRSRHLDATGEPDGSVRTLENSSISGMVYGWLSLAQANGRGGLPGLGLVLLGTDATATISVHATRLSATGAVLAGMEHLGNIGDAGDLTVGMTDVSASAAGLAAVYADHGGGSAGRVLFSTLETCF